MGKIKFPIRAIFVHKEFINSKISEFVELVGSNVILTTLASCKLTAITQLVHHGMLYVPIGYTFGAGMF